MPNEVVGGERKALVAATPPTTFSEGAFMMNWDVVKGNWKQVKGDIRKRWGKLTDDELEEVAGERDKLIGKLQEKYGYARGEAEKQVDAMLEDL